MRKLDMHEGPEAWERFREAMEAIVSVPKESVPPNHRTTLVKEKTQTQQ